MLQFRILGPTEAANENGPVALGGKGTRALLGLLLLRANEVVSTDHLVDQLWGENPPPAARAALQNRVAQLRRLLGAESLLSRPPGYMLRVDDAGFDLARFELLVSESRNVEAAERAVKLREALALWRGPPLADLAFEPFAQNEIRRLEELRLEALEERIAADLALGQNAELVAEVAALVGEHPLRERLAGHLMLALYGAGRQAEALEIYHELRRALSDELGIDLSPALQRLYGSMLRHEKDLVPTRNVNARHAEDHYAEVVKALIAGRLVVVLGAGANLGGVTEGPALPGLAETAAYLADCFDTPTDHRDLARISEYVALMRGVGPLYDELHDFFDRDYEPGPVHRRLAETAVLLRESSLPRPLVVTANFDLALERAFGDAGEAVDIVSYIALGRHRGRFLHLDADGAAVVVDLPNAYTGISVDDRTVILRLLGQVDRQPAREWESFTVTEDDHIDYLAQADISSLVPVTLVAKLRRSHFLFLGYPLSDWGLRVFLHRIWGRDEVAYRSWAVEPDLEPVERELWRRRGVDVLDLRLEEYLEGLCSRVAEAVR